MYKAHSENSAGFTLIELLIVISVLGVLAGGVVVAINPAGKINAAKMAIAETFSASLQNNLAMNLVGEWTFNDGNASTAKDTSGNGNNGTIYGADCTSANALDRKGQSGKACSFNGGAYIEVPDATSLQLSGNITMSAWAKAGNITNNSFIFGKGTDGSKGYVLKAESGGFYAAFTDTLGARHTSPGYTYTANTWYYVVATYNGSKFCFYVNGTPVGNCTLTTTAISTDTSSLFFGKNPAGGDPYFGTIDDARIYSASLLSSQIKQLYAQGLIRHLLAFK